MKSLFHILHFSVKKAVVFISVFMGMIILNSANVRCDTLDELHYVDNMANIYLVGDSRTYLGYKDTQDNRANWLATPGVGYSYFKNYFEPYLNGKVLSGKKVVILFGINDIIGFGPNVSAAEWLDFFSTTAQTWIAGGASVYMCSVPGVTNDILNILPDTDVAAVNKAVNEFNALMAVGLPKNVSFVPINHFTENPYKDGLHYSPEESIWIHESLINSLLAQ